MDTDALVAFSLDFSAGLTSVSAATKLLTLRRLQKCTSEHLAEYAATRLNVISTFVEPLTKPHSKRLCKNNSAVLSVSWPALV